MASGRTSSLGSRCAGAGAATFVVLYLGLHIWFLSQNARGERFASVAAYFFTWDMFPGYRCESRQYSLIGITRSGRFLQLYPGPEDQFRGGGRQTASRADLDHTQLHLPQIAQRAMGRYSAATNSERLTRVTWVDRYASSPFRLPDPCYKLWTCQEKPLEGMFYRITASADLATGTP